MPSAISGLLLIYNMDQGDQRLRNVVDRSKYVYHNEIYMCGDRVKGVYGQSRPKNPRMNALNRLPSTKTNKMPRGIHYGAAAATKWTNTSLTSRGMLFLLRYSIQTVVYLGTKLLGSSNESLDAANPFQRTL